MRLDTHCDKTRGMNVDNVGLEAQIDWNGHPVHLVDKLSEKTLDRILKGRSRWHFVTKDDKDTVVTKRLKQEKPFFPFFS